MLFVIWPILLNVSSVSAPLDGKNEAIAVTADPPPPNESIFGSRPSAEMSVKLEASERVVFSSSIFFDL
jgi:hypothetical protein